MVPAIERTISGFAFASVFAFIISVLISSVVPAAADAVPEVCCIADPEDVGAVVNILSISDIISVDAGAIDVEVEAGTGEVDTVEGVTADCAAARSEAAGAAGVVEEASDCARGDPGVIVK